MILTTHHSADDFLAIAQTALEQHEVENGLILGVAQRLQREGASTVPAPYLATVETSQGLLVAGLITPPRNLILSSRSTEDSEALTLLAGNLLARRQDVPGVVGEAGVAQRFVEIWKRLSGHRVTEVRHERLFQLTVVTHPVLVPGRLREATELELDLLNGWVGAFLREALNEDNPQYAQHYTQNAIGRRALYVWETPDGQVVTMAASTRPLKHTISVGMVYTPPELRGHGYASNCVAALSQHLLDKGWERCTLYTDLANPTSNSIYQKMGYQTVRDHAEYHFD